ncbi:MAG: hypothetical protein ACYCPO_12160 [Acidobacteriaceae bacterium]
MLAEVTLNSFFRDVKVGRNAQIVVCDFAFGFGGSGTWSHDGM